jgi:hypothetical protein
VELIIDYLVYVKENYAKDFEKYIPRQAPSEFVDEYNALISKTLNPQRKTVRDFLFNFPIDRKSLMFCYA